MTEHPEWCICEECMEVEDMRDALRWDPDVDGPPPSLGPCCGCGTDNGVDNVLMIPYKAAAPSRGWGCIACGLPFDGCLVVLCDICLDAYQEDALMLQTVCRGYPAEDGREAFAAAVERGGHIHDDAAHYAREH